MIEVKDVSRAIADLIHGRTHEEWLAAMENVRQVAEECHQYAQQAVDQDAARERVARGAAYLDKKYPGWRKRMPEGWRIASCYSCPLSTATGRDFTDTEEWDDGRGLLFVEEHGFLGGNRMLDTLQLTWEAELAD